MRFPSTFNRECQQVAAVLEHLNPGGETPKALRPYRPCVDCGRPQRNGYLCDRCQSTHTAPVRG